MQQKAGCGYGSRLFLCDHQAFLWAFLFLCWHHSSLTLLLTLSVTVGNLFSASNNLLYSQRFVKESHRSKRNEAETERENSWTGSHERPWKVGLCNALQKPWETLSQYIKDTVCSSSLLLFLPLSFSPLFSFLMFLLRLFSSSSTRLLSVSSFTLLFRLFFFHFFSSDPL